MSQEPREIPKESSFLPSKETEMSISDVSISPAKEIRTIMSQEPRETIQQLCFLGVSISPAKKRERTSISQVLQDYRSVDSDETTIPLVICVPISVAKNIPTDMSHLPRETAQDSSSLRFKGTELCLSGVSISPAKTSKTSTRQEPRETPQEYLFLASKEMKMPLTGVPISPAKSMSQEPREIPKDYIFLPPEETDMEMSLSSVYPTNTDEDLKKTDCWKDLKKCFVSTTLCLYDETWPCGNLDNPNVTCVPIDEELIEQARKIKEMRFHSKEQKEEEEERYGVSDPWIIKRELTKTDCCRRLYLNPADVESHILRYLSEEDQKKLRPGCEGITVNVYDHDTHTTHKVVLMRWAVPPTYFLKNTWRKHFVYRRSLKKGDKIGLFWDCFHSKLHLSVLSRAIAKVHAEDNESNFLERQ